MRKKCRNIYDNTPPRYIRLSRLQKKDLAKMIYQPTLGLEAAEKRKIIKSMQTKINDPSGSVTNNILSQLEKIAPPGLPGNAVFLEAARIHLNSFALGRQPLYDADSLGEVFLLFLNSVERDTVTVKEMIKSGNSAGVWSGTENKKPLTVERFCVFAGLSKNVLYNYANNNIDPRIQRVAAYIIDVCHSDLIDSALMGVVNARIVELLTGLQQTVNINTTAHSQITVQIDGGPIDLTKKPRISENLQKYASDCEEV